MKPILVVWEDEDYSALHTVLCRALEHLYPESFATTRARDLLHPESANGYGGFKPFLAIGKQWHTARNKGKRYQGKAFTPESALCILDADKAAEAIPSASAAPSAPADLEIWRSQVVASWTSQLRIGAHEPDRVSGEILLWNRESVMLAVFPPEGIPADLSSELGWGDADDRWQEALRTCGNAAPTSSTEYRHEYRKPLRCLNDHLQLKKRGAQSSVILKAGSKPHLIAGLLDRCPDLRAIAEAAHQLMA